MAKKTTSKKANAEKHQQRRDEMEKLHQQLTEQVENLRTSEGWQRYLKAATTFHTYSLNNLLLIFLQCPQASAVAGYRAWQKKGRQVRKGEKGIRILGGRAVTLKDDEGNEVTDDQGRPQRRMMYFPTSVFDISQTDATEEWAEPVKLLTGVDEAGIYERVEAYLIELGYTVARETMTGKNGYTTHVSDGKHVGISDTLEPAAAAKTIIHEAGHIVAGHVTEAYDEYVAHRGRCEVEAESVAYIVAGMLGLDTAAYSVGYIAGWSTAAETAELADTATKILTTARTIVQAIEPDQAEAENGDAA